MNAKNVVTVLKDWSPDPTPIKSNHVRTAAIKMSGNCLPFLPPDIPLRLWGCRAVVDSPEAPVVADRGRGQCPIEVVDSEPILKCVSQGENFRQIRGTRRLTLLKGSAAYT